MKNHKNYTKMIIALILLCSLMVFPLASSGLEITDTITIPPSGSLSENPFATIEAMQYASSPDHLTAFIYENGDTHLPSEVNLEDCEYKKLYVYNSETKTLTQITTQDVQAITATKDYLFYIANNTIYKTGYDGGTHRSLYESEIGFISNFHSFGTYLYFIENFEHIVVCNWETQSVSRVTPQGRVLSLFMFDVDKILWRDDERNPFYLNTTTSENIAFANEYEVNALLCPYIAPEFFVQDGDASLLYLRDMTREAHNDIEIPLGEYPATLGYGLNGILTRPVQSRFNRPYINASQCDGFAKYVHDTFWHLNPNTRTTLSWITPTGVTDDYVGYSPTEIASHVNPLGQEGEEDEDVVLFYNWGTSSQGDPVREGNTKKVRDFFHSIERGAFIRYIPYTDETEYDGRHSIFFDELSDDEQGIYAYECNQDNNNGVFYTKYTFEEIAGQYAAVLYYVDHTLEQDATYYSSERHKVECEHCDGYLLQSHRDNATSFVSVGSSGHRLAYSCCTSTLPIVAHTFLPGSSTCKACGYNDIYIDFG